MNKMTQKINYWKGAKFDPERLKNNKYINPPKEEVKEEVSDISDKIEGNYIEMPRADTYALGVHALREQCEKENNQNHPKHNGIYIPLTFKETIEARVNEYNKGNKELFNNWLSTSSGIVYKANSTKFKIIPLSKKLVNIDKDFNDDFISVDYSSFKEQELDFSKGKYDKSLTQDEVLEHKAWNAMLEEDKTLLKAYTDIIFKGFNKDKAMGVYKHDNPRKDQLRALHVVNIGNNSSANGSINLSDGARFLRVAPSATRAKK